MTRQQDNLCKNIYSILFSYPECGVCIHAVQDFIPPAHQPEYSQPSFPAGSNGNSVRSDVFMFILIKSSLVLNLKVKVYAVSVEEQSEWSENILVRMLLYITQTIREYASDNNLDLFSQKKVPPPVPELYAIYAGDKRLKNAEISLKDKYFGGKKRALDVRIKIFAEPAERDIADQLPAFCGY